MFSRAERRHHKDRMKAKARRVAHVSWGYRISLGRTADEIARGEQQAIKAADHLALCGRPCCANPRHNGWNVGRGSLTMQEIRRLDETRTDAPPDADADRWSSWSADWW